MFGVPHHHVPLTMNLPTHHPDSLISLICHNRVNSPWTTSLFISTLARRVGLLDDINSPPSTSTTPCFFGCCWPNSKSYKYTKLPLHHTIQRIPIKQINIHTRHISTRKITHTHISTWTKHWLNRDFHKRLTRFFEITMLFIFLVKVINIWEIYLLLR